MSQVYYELLLDIRTFSITLLVNYFVLRADLRLCRLMMQTWYKASWLNSQFTDWLFTPEVYSETSKLGSEYTSGLVAHNLQTAWITAHYLHINKLAARNLQIIFHEFIIPFH